MTFYDQDCGIEVAHIHTGELVIGSYLQYWCPHETAWVKEAECGYDTHTRARTQETVTEIIEIVPAKVEFDWTGVLI